MAGKTVTGTGAQISIAPLVVFRIIFGTMMFLAVIRFILNGWVEQQYLQPGFYFSYFGFEWLPVLPAWGLYSVFAGMAVAALGIAFGFFYRFSAILFFLLFSYVEFLDKSNYLNHYYFVTIVSGLMIFLPAGKAFSLDCRLRGVPALSTIPRAVIFVLQLQLGLVYFFAGLAKVNYEWLIEAMPLRIWLPAHNDLPLVGPLLALPETAYVFSWFGCIYDLSIPFLLLSARTRLPAYFAVIVFHVSTALLFQIGMFPWIMILSTLIFFPASFHLRLLRIFDITIHSPLRQSQFRFPSWIIILFVLHFSVQAILPFRHLLYPGELFWTEQGYRFSWRVMLMEKAGTAFFYVKDSDTGKQVEVSNREFLTPNQEKMMATQPDMILQYAKHLADVFKQKGFKNPEVRADVFVTLNGTGSRRFIDPNINLAGETESFSPKAWILPYENAPWLVEKNKR